MIPRSIWRWMILDIKRKKKEKRIQLLSGLIGICVAVVSLFYFFHAEKTEAEKRMVEIVNYVKVQCSTYTHYNESSESKSLLRAIESARQMSTNIKTEKENGGHLSREFLKENLSLIHIFSLQVDDVTRVAALLENMRITNFSVLGRKLQDGWRYLYRSQRLRGSEPAR